MSAVEDQSKNLSKALEEITLVEGDIASCEQQCHQDIEQAFGAMYRTLQKSEQTMKEKVTQELKSIGHPVKMNEERLKTVQSEIVAVVGQARHSLQEGDVEFLTQQGHLQQRLQQLQQKLRKIRLNVDRPLFITPKVMADDILKQQLDKYNGLQYFDSSKWQVSGSLLHGHAEIGQLYKIHIENKTSKFRKGSQNVIMKFEAD